MHLRSGGAADQQRQSEAGALHFRSDRDHFIEAGGDQAAEADHVGLVLVGGVEDVLPGHHHPEVDHFEAVALQDDSDDVLADIVDVALDGRHHDPALALGRAACLFLRLDEGDQMRDRLLHHPRRFHHLRQEHLARSEQVADDVHAVHQRPFDHFDRPRRPLPRQFGVLDDEGVDALDQGMFEPFLDRPAAPFRGFLLPNLVGAEIFLGKRDQPLGRIHPVLRPPVEDHVLAGLAQLRIDRVVDIELAGIDDRHVEAGGDGVEQEYRMHRPPHRLVAAEREAEIGKAAGNVHPRAARLDLAAGLDEIQRVAAMLVDAGGDGEDVGIEDDVLGREAVGDEQPVGALANLDLALLAVGLADFVERHHHHGRAIIPHQAGMFQELLFAFLHADRVHDRLAGHAFQPGLDHAPPRAVDHERHPGDVGLGRDQLQEGGHRHFGVEQALVHVDVDDLGAALDLLAGDFDRRGIVAGHDQLLEAGRSGDVGPLADIDERRRLRRRRGNGGFDFFRRRDAGEGAAAVHGHQAARIIGSIPDRRVRCCGRGSMRGAQLANPIGDRADVRGRGSAAAADDVDQSLLRPFLEMGGGGLRAFVIIAEIVGQAGIGVSQDQGVGDAGQGWRHGRAAGPRRTSS